MKTFFKSAILASAIALLAACGGQAQAAPINANTFEAGGNLFSDDRVLIVTWANGGLTLTYDNGLTSVAGYYPDPNGAVFNKMLATGRYVKDPAQPKLYRTSGAHLIRCNPSTGATTFYWLAISTPGMSDFADPGCSIYNQIKANAN